MGIHKHKVTVNLPQHLLFNLLFCSLILFSSLVQLPGTAHLCSGMFSCKYPKMKPRTQDLYLLKNIVLYSQNSTYIYIYTYTYLFNYLYIQFKNQPVPPVQTLITQLCYNNYFMASLYFQQQVLSLSVIILVSGYMVLVSINLM